MERIKFWALAASLAVLPAALAEDLVKVDGTVSGFSGITTDNIVDGAMVLPSMSADDIISFQIDQFMGPPETMTVGGLFSADVPSNFYFPKQKERWGFFPVSFGKESFYIMAEKGDKRELVSAWFQVPWDVLMDQNQNGGSPTALLPHLKIKKHGLLAEKDWSTVSSISMKLDKALSTKVKLSWDRATVTGNDTDVVVLFQGTKSGKWAFVNLKGNPAKNSEIESMKGLEEGIKVMFMRTHSNDTEVTGAEGWVRHGALGDKITVKNLPDKLVGKLNGSKITWTKIDEPGWMNLVISPKEEEPAQPLFMVSSLLGRAFEKADEAVQMWLDPKAGTTGSLGSDAVQNMDITLSYVGTTAEVPMPAEGQDNTAFLEAASEIRMNKLQ